MKLRENRLMLIWLFCVGMIFFGCVVAYFQGWWDIINKGDQTKISFINFGLFLVGLAVNGRNTFRINRELKSASEFSQLCEKGCLDNEVLNTAWKNSDSSLASAHIMNLHKIANKQKNGDVNQSVLIEIMAVELEAPETWTRHIAMTLASFGLFGTLVGFVISMDGLDILMGMDKATSLQGLQKAIHGMGTAFYATLMAVIFGAVFLELLHRLVSNAITKLVITMAKTGEIYIIPEIKAQFMDKNSASGEICEIPK